MHIKNVRYIVVSIGERTRIDDMMEKIQGREAEKKD